MVPMTIEDVTIDDTSDTRLLPPKQGLKEAEKEKLPSTRPIGPSNNKVTPLPDAKETLRNGNILFLLSKQQFLLPF